MYRKTFFPLCRIQFYHFRYGVVAIRKTESDCRDTILIQYYQIVTMELLKKTNFINRCSRLKLLCLFVIILSSYCGAYAAGAKDASVNNVGKSYFGTDTLEIIAPEKMIKDLKNFVAISVEEEKLLMKLFKDRNDFLKVPHTGPERKKLTLGNISKKVKEVVGDQRFDRITKVGLIDNWFKVS